MPAQDLRKRTTRTGLQDPRTGIQCRPVRTRLLGQDSKSGFCYDSTNFSSLSSPLSVLYLLLTVPLQLCLFLFLFSSHMFSLSLSPLFLFPILILSFLSVSPSIYPTLSPLLTLSFCLSLRLSHCHSLSRPPLSLPLFTFPVLSSNSPLLFI